MLKRLWKVLFAPPAPQDIQCPTCGYYCLGKGGRGCIDKPSLQPKG